MELASKFKEAAIDARIREKNEKYEKPLDISGSVKYNDKTFYIAKYIPSNLDVLICYSPDKTCAIVRINKHENKIVSIKDIDIQYEIADVLKCKLNCPMMILSTINNNIEFAKELADKINELLNTNISYRYLIKTKR